MSWSEVCSQELCAPRKSNCQTILFPVGKPTPPQGLSDDETTSAETPIHPLDTIMEGKAYFESLAKLAKLGRKQENEKATTTWQQP